MYRLGGAGQGLADSNSTPAQLLLPNFRYSIQPKKADSPVALAIEIILKCSKQFSEGVGNGILGFDREENAGLGAA